ncbi:MAG: hypothetical protein LQ351_008081 [Letrouitia transgressa]|nr:MAG: hypothetical protein LQ351_008081 [Letrouitia transgressa]
MEVAVPKTRITPLSKPGFMEDIKNQNTTVKHLKDVAEAQEKAALLTASSPVPPKTSLSDTYNYNYSPLIEQYNITERELESVFKRAKAGKAPGPDGIPNQDLHLAKAKLIPLLRPIFNACMQRGIHPQEWDN